MFLCRRLGSAGTPTAVHIETIGFAFIFPRWRVSSQKHLLHPVDRRLEHQAQYERGQKGEAHVGQSLAKLGNRRKSRENRFLGSQGRATYQIGDAHVFWRSDGSGQVQLDESVGQIAAISQSTYRDKGPRRQKLFDHSVLAGDACQYHPAGEDAPPEPVQAIVQGALDVRVFVVGNVVKRHREHGNSANNRS